MLQRKLNLQIKLAIQKCPLYYIFKYYNFYYCHILGNILVLFKNRESKGVLKEKYKNAISCNYSLKSAYMICYEKNVIFKSIRK